MSLSSLVFVFGFFPIFFIIYYLSKDKFRNYIILVGSLFFYFVNGKNHFGYILGLCILVYVLTMGMKKYENTHPKIKKGLAIFGITAVVCSLLYYRYLDYFILKIGMITGIKIPFEASSHGVPVGLSFLTFSVISYIADCYTGKIKPQRNPLKLVTYILMFPKIIMGPIVRYSSIENSIDCPTPKTEDVGDGIKRFVIGFSKKIIIADNLAVLVSQIQNGGDYSGYPVLLLWLGSIAYSLQLFYDFSGYSDMAIGCAQMLGFHFEENFNYPYCAKSITDFWRRWHISLSFWFRDYIYIPLGGSKRSLLRNIMNLLVVWLLTGLWHGVTLNFIIWGLIFFFALIFERYVLKLKERKSITQVIWRIISLLIINFNWVIFNNTDWKSALAYCKGMLGMNGTLMVSTEFYRYTREYGIYLLLGVLFSMPIIPYVTKTIRKHDKYGVFEIVSPIALVLALIWAVSFIMLGSHNPFLYQQF